MKLPDSAVDSTRPGLVMIQVDGLSRPELALALERGEMPFLKRLLRRESCKLHTMYSGLPAATPAVQAELFYGVRTAVPAFSFRSSGSGKLVRMYEPEAAEQVEARLEQEGEPLLAQGSAYSDNFTGGAAEAHFCPAALGWGPSIRAANPNATFLLLITNLYSLVRILVLLPVELVLALVDFGRGLAKGRNFLKELKFVPTRVAICILLRELCVIGGRIDINRGLPIIHINLLGYDEQSHRRGPASRFAHWTLKGIDDAIARLWRAAHSAPGRHYDVWIYSDHGQHHASSYHKLQGYSVKEAVDLVLAGLETRSGPAPGGAPETVETHRVRLLGGGRFQRLFSVFQSGPDSEELQVASLGPVAFVYPPGDLGATQRVFLASELVRAHGVPVAITRDQKGALRAWTATGEFALPRDTASLFGRSHPFVAELPDDLARLCNHPEAGELVLLGWHAGAKPITFAEENGSHAGATPQETTAFALLPSDTLLPDRPRDYLRPLDLREAALQHLGRRSFAPRNKRIQVVEKPSRQLRIVTYNVHSCIGMDGKLSARRIARVIARTQPDIVALQELDVGRSRSGHENQAQVIAHYLTMEHHFHPVIHVENEQYGDAILSHLPMRLVKAACLPPVPGPGSRREPRGAVWVAVEVMGTEIQVINTHLGLWPGERLRQVQELLGRNWLGHPDCQGPVILCGDFNATPGSAVCRMLRARLDDAQIELASHRPRNTFSSNIPAARIDHIFLGGGVEVTAIDTPQSQLARLASDHRPLVATLKLPVAMPDTSAMSSTSGAPAQEPGSKVAS
ncbi:oxidoreductase [Kineobactrum salinum]|uniref:Oxidoreductase n=2 Tax=Kineobactrum salinum TaxID=2708301 RepID=A0A6C0U8M8_9GAMM|nr:oxidoreductase [Kineobactrum salinum]